MNEKYWDVHIKDVLAFKIKPLLEFYIEKDEDMLNLGFSRSSQGFRPSNLSISTEVLQQLANLDKDYETKENSMDDEKQEQTDLMIDDLIYQTPRLYEKYSGEINLPAQALREKKLLDLGLTFLKSAYRGDNILVEYYVEKGFNINFQHPSGKRTALHNSAASSAVYISNFLIQTGKCDYLLEDFDRMLAYQTASRYGNDKSMTRLLIKKTFEQAEERNIPLKLNFPNPYPAQG